MMVQAEGGSSDQLALLLCHIARLASLLVVYEHLAASRACCQAEFARLLGHKKKVIAAIMIQTRPAFLAMQAFLGFKTLKVQVQPSLQFGFEMTSCRKDARANYCVRQVGLVVPVEHLAHCSHCLKIRQE